MTSASSIQQLGWLRYALKWGKRSWWMTLALWFVAIAPAWAQLELRVAIEQDTDQIDVGSSAAAVIKDGSGKVLASIPETGGFLTAAADNGTIDIDQWEAGQVWIEPSENSYVYIDGNFYRGRTLVTPTAGGLTAVNYVDMEQYLYSVVGGEMPDSWPLEALKAQAVAARSYVLFQRQSGANTVFDVGDTQRWQVYKGIGEETVNTIAAVEATRGQVLTYDGQIIEAVFHSSSGGYTENVEDVWTRPLPYLRAVQDFDQGAPVYEWNETFTADQIRQRITGVGNILSFAPERTTNSGRIISMRVSGDAGTRVLSGSELRDALNLKSTLFSIVAQPGQIASASGGAPAPNTFRVIGRGFGHGLGMSQWGAHNLAQRGYNYQQIVTHYYTGATLAMVEVQ